MKIEIEGEFTFKPLDILGLTNLICSSGISNKVELLEMLYWAQQCEYAGFLWPSDKEVTEVDKKANSERYYKFSAGMHLRYALNSQGDGEFSDYPTPYPAKVRYAISPHKRRFRSFAVGKKNLQPDWKAWNGYNEVREVLSKRGCTLPKYLWFVSFILQLPQELQKLRLSIATPFTPLFREMSMYPCYMDGHLSFHRAVGNKNGRILEALNQSYLFGVREVQRI